MLAATLLDPKSLHYPVLATPKVDGIRCLKVDGRVVTRALKLVPNEHIRLAMFSLPDGVDGELVIPGGTFQDVASAVMSFGGKPEFEYLVFDFLPSLADIATPYSKRVTRIPIHPYVVPLTPIVLESISDFERYEERTLDAGYEGLVVRAPGGPYKFGRSTLREGYMIKYKRTLDADAVVLGIEEQLMNCNPMTRDILGRAERKGGRALALPKGTMGSLIVQDTATGVVFNIGSGFSDTLRAAVWADPSSYVGRVVTYRYQSVGVKSKPRFPRFIAFRED